MQTPSQGLQGPLPQHLHLISGHRFPVIASLDLNQALNYLLDAPTIVKGMAPMAWTYVSAPQDGTIWLEWLAQDRADNRFPSDGYVWGDPEAAYRHEFRGYTIEMMKHTIGYRVQFDQMASHARTRYHIVAKNPSVNAPPPDPALWIVHYHQAEHRSILPSSQVPFPPQMQQVMTERRWLESQGKIERRDFMLHDRQSWPMIKIPSGATMPHQGTHQPGYSYGSQIQQNRFPGYYNQQAGQQPPAKRQRPNPQAPGSSGDVGHDVSIEDEENTTLGDFFDHLTPRDISTARYSQHHRWMEEVFSSPYVTNQIVPPDLGMGLMGELKKLTEGILEPPSLDLSADKPSKAKEAQPFTNLSKEQVSEFNSRMDRHMEEGQAEIERMKAEHEEKMREWRKGSKLMALEKRLRTATFEGDKGATPAAFRLEDPAVYVPAPEGGKEDTVEDLVEEAEELLGVKIGARKEADLIEKGGLEREEEQPKEQPVLNAGLDQQQNVFMGQQQQQQQQQSVTSAMGGSDIYHGDPASAAMHTQGESIQQPSMQPPAQQSQPPMPQSAPAHATHGTPSAEQTDDLDVSGMDDTAMDGMELDESAVDFGDTSLDLGAEDTPGSGLGMSVGGTPNVPSTTQLPAASTAVNPAPSGMSDQQPSTLQQPSTSSDPTGIAADASNLDVSAMTGATGAGDGDETDPMFGGDDTFGDMIADDDGGADFDFSTNDMGGMDSSAFGDATFGMDAGTPAVGQNAGEAEQGGAGGS